MIRILYVGPLWSGSTCLQRMYAMKELGHEIVPVDTEPEDVKAMQKRFFCRVKRKLFGPADMADVNHRVCQLAKETEIDFLWLDKALTITPGTFKFVRQIIPKTIIVGYSPDDMATKHNQSRHFLKGLPLYDIYFTTKSYNVRELKTLGCPKVVFVGNAYDPNTHRPLSISKEDHLKFGGPVGFIGDYERERAEAMFYLAENGIPVRVWGPNWNKKSKLSNPNLKIEGRSLWGEDYAKAICSFDINLGFLRKINRDLQTQRSVEIPACGAFMLAERTNEHLGLFKEGKEAEFFNTKEELFEKVKYYLKNEDERKRIAQAGRERCLKSGYSYHDRIKGILKVIEGLREKR